MFHLLHQQLTGWMKRSRVRRVRRTRTLGRLTQVEGLESRRVLASDASVAGDCDRNGAFDTSDLVQAFQHGKFETESEANWDQGDWNGDGRFNSSDLVMAFQHGRYDQPGLKVSSLETPDDNPSPSDVPADPNVGGGETTGQPVDDSGNDVGDDHDNHRHGVPRLQKVVDSLKAALAAGGDLPGNLTAEEVTKLVADLEAAMAAGNRDAAREILKGLHDVIKDAHDDGEDDDKPGHHGDGRGDDHGHATPEKVKARLQSHIDALQAAVDADKLPTGVTKDQVVAAIAAAKTALDAGDLGAAHKALNDLYKAIHDARDDDKDDSDGDDDDRDDDSSDDDGGDDDSSNDDNDDADEDEDESENDRPAPPRRPEVERPEGPRGRGGRR